MKLLYLIEEAKLGGPQVQMARVAHALSSRASVKLVFPKSDNKALETLCKDLGLSYRTAFISRITRELIPFLTFGWRTPFELLLLARLISRERPSLIHAWGGSWQFKAVLLSKITGVPCVWLLNDTYAPGSIRWSFKYIARFCRFYISASRATERYYAPLLPSGAQSIVIQSMVDFEAFDPLAQYRGDEELIASIEGDTVIGLIANINPVKGIDTFIRVAARARKAKCNCRFVVVGSIFHRQESLLNELKALARSSGADNVLFVGGRDDVRPLLQRFDIYLCTSLTESSPVSVWEAMAMGKPIVSTPVGDVPEFVKDEESGYLAPVGDDEGLWRATERLVIDPARRLRMGQAARERARAAFSREAIVDRTWQFYQSVLDASAAEPQLQGKSGNRAGEASIGQTA